LKRKFADVRNSLSTILRECQISEERYKRRKEEMAREYERIVSGIDLDELNKQKLLKFESNVRDLEELRERFVESGRQMQGELSERKRFHESSTELCNKAMEEFRESCRKSELEISQENQRIEDEISARFPVLVLDLQKRKNETQAALEQTTTELSDLKESHVVSVDGLIQTLNHEFEVRQKEMVLERQRVSEHVREVKKFANNMKDGIKQKQELNDALAVLQTAFDQAVKEDENCFSAELASITEVQAQEWAKLTEEQNLVLNEVQKSAADLISEKKEEHSRKLESFCKSQEGLRQKTFNELRLALENNGVITDLSQQLASEYSQLSKEYKDLEEHCGEEMNHATENSDIKAAEDSRNELAKNISDLRSDLVKSWEEQLSREEARFASLSFVREVDVDERLSRIRENNANILKEFDDHITELSRSLISFKQSDQTVGDWDAENDDEVVRLKLIIEQLRRQLKATRKAARSKLEADVDAANEQLKRDRIEQSFAIDPQIEENKKLQREFYADFEHWKSERVTIEEDLEKNKDLLMKAFNETQERCRHKHSLALLGYEERVADCKRRFDDVEEVFKRRQCELDARLESLLSEAEGKYAICLQSMGLDWEKTNERLNSMLKSAESERDSVKERFIARGMRASEKQLIDRLQDLCNVKTESLATIVKNLSVYRSQMQWQESEYNKRFGVSPEIAIMPQASGGRRSCMKRVLPPLGCTPKA
jgi:hypothetical protein